MTVSGKPGTRTPAPSTDKTVDTASQTNNHLPITLEPPQLILRRIVADIFAQGTAGYARYQQTLPGVDRYLQAGVRPAAEAYRSTVDILTDNTPSHSQFAQDPDDPHTKLSLDELELQPTVRDTGARLILKHAEGNSAFGELASGMQAMTMSPKFITAEAGGRPLIEVIGIAQSPSEVSFSLHIRSISCDLYYIPLSDNIVLHNTGDLPLSLEYLSGGPNTLTGCEVAPGLTIEVTPASWRLSDRKSTVDLQLRQREIALRTEDIAHSAKRSAEEVQSQAKKYRGQTWPWTLSRSGETAASAKDRAVRPPDMQAKGIWPGVNIREHQNVHVVDKVTGSTEYSLERLDGWAHKTRSSHTFKALLHNHSSAPQAVVVKIILSSSSSTSAARAWQREYRAHRNLQHPCIAGLLGYDSRILSLYVELKPAMDLKSPHWCAQQGESSPGFFRGEMTDAVRILKDMSSALAYLDGQGIVHNDIKPGNILYTPAPWEASGAFSASGNGAVLIDFGLAGPVGETNFHVIMGGMVNGSFLWDLAKITKDWHIGCTEEDVAMLQAACNGYGYGAEDAITIHWNLRNVALQWPHVKSLICDIDGAGDEVVVSAGPESKLLTPSLEIISSSSS
ncbi:Serine/threonine-protein kinase tousled-like 2 [Diaporthe amygdali]|uniref:Serine/threonine-protein kinase tousled-like 2 n=1 Tax=Phomopsis amygdali TaxID=1214568 RepID=UPI0022FEAD3F|nr:Serine/threonine-protein kinase tousled-like 2 [Diaporthe amygdali]KAJ0123555.1 Serine/threonine-protein kinase tousled-like 2 [Diaporthe amygdali]